MKTALLSVANDTVSIGIPITKNNINVEKRIVSGWATIDNVDQMDDVVTADASLNAFSSFRGNVREMHENIAAGKVLHFEQKEYYDIDGDRKTGIYVDVYVSKGAENTWQKVLDGTLNGFSIKGPILPGGKRTEYRDELNKTVNVITAYRLVELSLVDNPGNELCNVLSIQKVNDVFDAQGIATNVEISSVFWCDKEQIAVVTKEDKIDCHSCSQPMENAGWFEQIEGENPGDNIKKVLQNSGKISIESTDVAKGGLDMADEKVVTEEVAKVIEPVTETVEKVNEPTLEKISEAVESVKKSLDGLQRTGEGHDAALEEVKKAVTGVKDEVEKNLAELQEKHEDLSKKFAEAKAALDELSKRVDTVETGEAVQKSLTVEKTAAPVEKDTSSFWSSTFLPGNNFD